MKRIFKRTLSFFLAVVIVLGSAPLAGLVGLELPNISGWFAALKAKAASDTISISTSPSRIRYSLDSEGNVYINGSKSSSFSLDINFSTESTEEIGFSFIVTAPDAFSGDVNYINTGYSTSKAHSPSKTVKLNISNPLALSDSKIEIKAYKDGTNLLDESAVIGIATVSVEKFAFSDEDLSEIKKSASIQIKPDVKSVTYNGETIADNEINFTATIYNNIPPKYHGYEDYIKSTSDFDLELDSISGEKGDFCKKISVDSVKNVVIKPGESYAVNGTMTLDDSPSDFETDTKEAESTFRIEFEGESGGQYVRKFNDCTVTITNSAFVSPINGSNASVDIKWPTNAINLDGLANLGLSLSECNDIADIVLVELAMFTLPPKTLQEKIGTKMLNKVFKCNAHIGAFLNEMRLVFPVTVDGVDMEIEIICNTMQFSWDGTPYGSFSNITYEAYTLEGLFNKRKYHSKGTAGAFAAANVQTFFDSVHDFAVSEISSATSKCFKTQKGVKEILFKTIPQLVLSKKGKGKALENAGIDLYINAVKQITIDCPIDVFVYNSSGQLCASVENNEATLTNDDIEFEINGASKILTLYSQDYKIVTKATANGSMDVTVEEMGYINGALHKYEMSDVPLTPGEEYTLNVSGKLNEDPLDYNLTAKDGDVINNQEVTGDKDTYIPGSSGGITWTFNQNTGRLVISGTGAMEDYYNDVYVPWYDYKESIKSVTIGNYVTNIGSLSFCGYDALKNVTIGNRVTSIGSYAFGECTSLTNITIPDSVTTIEDAAFKGCVSLENIVIGDGVTSLSSFSFRNHNNLRSVVIGNGVKTIDNGTFYNCDSLVNVMIGNGVTSIGDGAFYRCTSLENVTIGNGVTSIGDEAFYRCTSLGSVTIPDSVTSMGGYVFLDCTSLANVTIGKGITHIENVFVNCENMTDVYYTGTIGDWCKIEFTDSFSTPMAYGDNLYIDGVLIAGDIVFPNGITSIGAYAFANCDSLVSIKICDGVTSIGGSAFYGCDNLTSITIPDSVITIGDGAFSSCHSLTSITIPNSVTNMGDSAFWNCSNLMSVIIGNSVTAIGKEAFYSCDSLVSIKICDGVTSIGGHAFYDCDNLTSITIPDSVITIGDGAFSSCRSLTSITIPDSVTFIGDCAFGWCDLKSITIPYSVQSIGISPFSGCRSLKEINVDDSNPFFLSDEYGVLYNKDKTHLIEFPCGSELIKYNIYDTVTIIGASAFSASTVSAHSGIASNRLKSIVVPKSIITIGDYAFENCDNLTEVYYTGYKEQWKKISIGLYNEDLIGANIHYKNIVDEAVVTTPSKSTINYGDSIMLHIDVDKIPENGYISWTVSNDNFDYSVSADGTTCTITPIKSGNTIFTATIYDAQGNAVSKDEQTMTSKAGFFDKIIAFFKKLFGLTKTIPQVYKGIF